MDRLAQGLEPGLLEPCGQEPLAPKQGREPGFRLLALRRRLRLRLVAREVARAPADAEVAAGPPPGERGEVVRPDADQGGARTATRLDELALPVALEVEHQGAQQVVLRHLLAEALGDQTEVLADHQRSGARMPRSSARGWRR